MKASDFIGWLQYTLAEVWGYIWGKCGILWTQARQNDLTKKYNADPAKYSDYKSAVQYGKKWIGHMVADCANLLRWCAKKSGDDGVHSGSNLIWQCDLAKKGELRNGQRTDGEPLKPGTFVFTGTRDKHPHVGAYIGNGKVMEDVGTQTGVACTSLFAKTKDGSDKWGWWGERKGMIFDVEDGEVILPKDPSESTETGANTPSAPADDTILLPTLKRGDKGEKVRELQAKLIALGYSLPKYGVDGDFGKETKAAVEQFQRDWGIPVSGIVDEQTWEKLLTVPEKPKLYTVRIEHLSAEMADEIISKYGGEKVAEG